MKLTFIGYGAMAKAMIAPLLKEYEIEVIGRDENKLKDLKLTFPAITTKKLEQIDISKKNIILCVKPYALKSVASELNGEAKLLISVLAGTSLDELKENIKAASHVRAMPNLAAVHQASATTFTGDANSKDEAGKILEAIGYAYWLESEKELDIATSLAGCGPAYLALVAESLCDGAVKMGLKRDDAKALTSSLFEGFSKLLANDHPALIKDKVMSPGGVTAKGVASLEENGVRSAFIKAISSSKH